MNNLLAQHVGLLLDRLALQLTGLGVTPEGVGLGLIIVALVMATLRRRLAAGIEVSEADKQMARPVQEQAWHRTSIATAGEMYPCRVLQHGNRSRFRLTEHRRLHDRGRRARREVSGVRNGWPSRR